MEARKRIKATASRMPPARELLRLVLVSPLRVYFRYAPSRRGKDFAWSRLASHVHWLERAVDVRTTFGAALHVDPADTVGRYVYYFGVWEPNLTAWLSRYLRRGDVFIDVGANIGYFSLLASKLVGPGGGVVAIEPLSAVHDVLRANITANDARNIRPVRSAAWDVEEVVPLFTEPDGQLGMTTAYPTWGSRSELAPAEMVAGRPLAALLKAEELSRARVIKIDAEGAEWRALNGLRPALSSLREDVAIVIELDDALQPVRARCGADEAEHSPSR